MRPRLGELLIEQEHITSEQLDAALERQRSDSRRLGSLLVADGALDAAGLLAALAQQRGTPGVSFVESPPSEAAMALVPPPLLRRLEVVPLALDEAVLTVAMVDPDNELAKDEVRAASGYQELAVRVATEQNVAELLMARFDRGSAVAEAIETGGEVSAYGGFREDSAPLEPEDAERPHVVSLVANLLATALARGASEVHIEPFASSSRVRLRLDGSLVPVMTLPRRLHGPCLMRLRQLAGLTELDPMRGVLRLEADGVRRRFAMITLDTVHGEKAALVSIDFDPRALDALDLPGQSLSNLRSQLAVPRGLFLVVGPRGAGRTTTAFALAAAVNQPSRQVVVVTASSEQQLPGALVVPILEEWDASFYVEHALAHDPDVLVIDSADDGDTLHLAAKAAINGHMVIATVPGGRALEVLGRAVAAGVPAYVLAASLRCIIAQRLCRRVDLASAVPYEPGPSELVEFGLTAEVAAQASMKEPRPAAENNDTGYKGRVGLYETVFVTSELRRAIRDGKEHAELVQLAREAGYHTLWEDGLAKVMKGLTTFAELRAALTPAD